MQERKTFNKYRDIDISFILYIFLTHKKFKNN